MIDIWQRGSCSAPDLARFCTCARLLPYEGYYIVYFLAVIVFVCMAVLYSLTCRRIYFCQELQRNTHRDRQVWFVVEIQVLCSRFRPHCARSGVFTPDAVHAARRRIRCERNFIIIAVIFTPGNKYPPLKESTIRQFFAGLYFLSCTSIKVKQAA